MTEAEYIGSELEAADKMRIAHEMRIAELEAALREIWELYEKTEQTPAGLSGALYEGTVIANRVLSK